MDTRNEGGGGIHMGGIRCLRKAIKIVSSEVRVLVYSSSMGSSHFF